MSCCCERDNSFVPPPGSLSAFGKADWPIYESGGKWGKTDGVEGWMKRLERGLLRIWPQAQSNVILP